MLTLSNTDSISNTGIKCLSWTLICPPHKKPKANMIERTSGTQPRCLSYGGTVIILQPHGSLLPIPSKQERERERDPGWVWSRVSRTKFMLRVDAAILCGHPSPRRSSCLQAKGSTFISQPQLLAWPCESKYWPPTLQSSAQLTELILPWLRKALHPKNSPKAQKPQTPNFAYTVVSNFFWENCLINILGAMS